MKGRKRKFATEKHFLSLGDAVVCHELFGELLQDAVTVKVSPKACILYTRVRKLSDSGVRRLIRIFLGDDTCKNSFIGPTALGNISTAIPLTGDLEEHVVKYLV